MELTKEYLDDKIESLYKRIIEKFGQELDPIQDDIRAIKTELSEVKDLVEKTSQRDLADSNALNSAYVDHDNRLKVVEKMLGINNTKTA